MVWYVWVALFINCNETLMDEWQYNHLNNSLPNLEMHNKGNAEVVFEIVWVTTSTKTQGKQCVE